MPDAVLDWGDTVVYRMHLPFSSVVLKPIIMKKKMKFFLNPQKEEVSFQMLLINQLDNAGLKEGSNFFLYLAGEKHSFLLAFNMS